MMDRTCEPMEALSIEEESGWTAQLRELLPPINVGGERWRPDLEAPPTVDYSPPNLTLMSCLELVFVVDLSGAAWTCIEKALDENLPWKPFRWKRCQPSWRCHHFKDQREVVQHVADSMNEKWSSMETLPTMLKKNIPNFINSECSSVVEFRRESPRLLRIFFSVKQTNSVALPHQHKSSAAQICS